MSLAYFKVGSRDNIVASSSSLGWLNPEEGGSIKKFLNFFEGDDEEREEREPETSKSLDNGRLVHKYIENSDKFIIEDKEKPTEMMAGLLEKVVTVYSDVQAGFTARLGNINSTIVSSVKKADQAQAEILQIRACYEKIANLLKLNVDDTIKIFRCGRIEAKAYSSMNELTVLEKIVTEGEVCKELDYLKFLLGARNRHVLSKEDGEKVKNMCNSLYLHPEVSVLLGLRQSDFDDNTDSIDVFKEEPVYWREMITFEDGTKVPIQCKDLLDRLVVNHTKKRIRYKDLKSTRRSIYDFKSSFEYYRYYRQMAFYKRAISSWVTTHYGTKYNFSDYTVDVLIIPVENQGLHLTGVYELTQPWLYKGAQEARTILTRLAWHLHNKQFDYMQEEIAPNGGYQYMKFPNPE
jgi:hypothetical protein